MAANIGADNRRVVHQAGEAGYGGARAPGYVLGVGTRGSRLALSAMATKHSPLRGGGLPTGRRGADATADTLPLRAPRSNSAVSHSPSAVPSWIRENRGKGLRTPPIDTCILTPAPCQTPVQNSKRVPPNERLKYRIIIKEHFSE